MAKAKDDSYLNGQKKKTIQQLDNGVTAEFYYGENGEILVQKLIYPDGKRDISVRRTKEDLKKFSSEELDGAQRQVSKKRLIREGNKIRMAESPDSMYSNTTDIDLDTGEVVVKHKLRDRPWGGGTQEQKVTTRQLKKINKENQQQTDTNFKDELDGGMDRNSNTVFEKGAEMDYDSSFLGIEDLDPETLANLTDEEIIEWANSADDYERAIKLRDDAKKNFNLENDQVKPIELDTNASDPPIEKEINKNNKKIKTLEPKDLKTKSLESINKRGLSGKKIRINDGNIKTGSLKQVLTGTLINSAVNAAEETIETAVEQTAKKTVQKQMNTVNFIHPDQMSDIELASLTDEEFDEIKAFANNNKNKIEEWNNRRGKGKAEKVYNDFYSDEAGYHYRNTENTNPYQYTRPETNFEVDENGTVKIEKGSGTRTIEIEDNKTSRRSALDDINVKRSANTKSMDDVFDWMKKHKIGMLDIGINLFTSIGDYKNARRQGHGVLSSTARAAAGFAMGEMLGFWGSVGVGVFKGVGTMAVKGTELLYKENRKMNSAANKQVFGTAEFYDTQQLATMRQSGMEMAKMAQYNLQQTLMGNEASFLHR